MAGGVIGKVTTGGTGAGTHLVSATFYGTCATGASTAAKIVKLADANIDSATLITGMTLAVKFTNANSKASPTLTVQTNGGTQLIAAIAIKRYGTTAPSTSAATSWRAGAMVLFVYDGTYWVECSSIDDNTTYSRQTPASGGTTASLVYTGDMYNWDNKWDSANVTSGWDSSNSTSTSADGFTKTISVSGVGIIFITATFYSDTTSDTGTINCRIQRSGGTVAYESNRLTSATGMVMGVSATYIGAVTAADTITVVAGCTKDGTKYFNISTVALGCTSSIA